MNIKPGQDLLPYQLLSQRKYFAQVTPLAGVDAPQERLRILESEYASGYGVASVIYRHDLPDGTYFMDAVHLSERSGRLALHRARTWIELRIGKVESLEMTDEVGHPSIELDLDPDYVPGSYPKEGE